MYYRPLMYNEENDAKKIYENGFTNENYNFRESVLVAKYFRHILGYGDARVKTALKEFCRNNDKFFIEVPNFRNIKSAVTRSRREFVDKSKPISIFQSEIDIIKNIEGYKKRKVLFAVFVLAKLNNGYINNNRWNEIRRVLHSKITNKNILELMTFYNSLNLLYPTNNSSHKILFINNEGQSVFTISADDINNLKKVFENVFGRDLFTCVDCGDSFPKKSHNQKRCKDCSKKKERENHKLRNKRYYNKDSDGTRECA